MSHRYFKLLQDAESLRNGWMLADAMTEDGDTPQFDDGKPFEKKTRLEVPIYEAGKETDLSVTATRGGLVVRTSQAKAIEALAGADIERLPVRIPGHKGFELVNVVRRIRCVDETRSRFEKFTKDGPRPDLAGEYSSILPLYLDRSAIPPDANIFRIEGYTVVLVVSGTMKAAIEDAGCTGALFTELT